MSSTISIDRSAVSATYCGVPRVICGQLAILAAILSFAFNRDFMDHCRFAEMVTMNDVQSILDGYHRTPSFAQALTAYWHAPWIQFDIHCFRPVSGFQYWVETCIGLHFGFIWDAWFGFLLFVLSVWLCGMIAYRFTASAPLAFAAVAMGSGVRFYNTCQPTMWLAWYPMHQDILMIDFLLGAVLAFDYWTIKRTPLALATTWVFFVTGCLTKEHLFAFPFMAVSIALTRASVGWPRKFPVLTQSALMAAFVGLLVIVRRHMYAVPRDPHFRQAVLLHKPAMFMYSNLAIDVITSNYFTIALGALLVLFAWTAWYLRTRRIDLGIGGRIYVVVPAAIALVCLACWVTVGSPLIGLGEFIDSTVVPTKILTNACLLSTIFLVIATWNRRAVGTAWLLLFWSYLPVISFIGWHYAFPGGMFRAIYWPVLLQAALACIGRDLGLVEPVDTPTAQ